MKSPHKITQRIIDELPEIYQSIFPDFFKKLIPRETLATCEDCAMCKKGKDPQLPGFAYFSPQTKCCTYQPSLPNYLIGALLTDTDPVMDEGRRRIREIIRNKTGVNPQGILAPKKYRQHQKEGRSVFGRDLLILCPFYVKEGGLCSIWEFREAICLTYFCKSVAGKDGENFWDALRTYLNHAQNCLILYVLSKLNLDTEKLSKFAINYDFNHIDAEDVDGSPPSEENFRHWWGEWTGHEEEFYKKTFQLVRDLSAGEFEHIGGISQKVLLSWVTKTRQEMMSPEIPKILKKNPDLNIYNVNKRTCFVRSPTGFFKISRRLKEVLQLFDGQRSNQEIAQLILKQSNERLKPDLLVSLYQDRILINS